MKTEALTKRDMQAIETKRRIAAMGLEMFELIGYEEVTVRDICEKAGVSIGTFYHYFPTKGHLISDTTGVLDRVANRAYMRLKPDMSADEQMQHMFTTYARHVVNGGVELTIQSLLVQVRYPECSFFTRDRAFYRTFAN